MPKRGFFVEKISEDKEKTQSDKLSNGECGPNERCYPDDCTPGSSDSSSVTLSEDREYADCSPEESCCPGDCTPDDNGGCYPDDDPTSADDSEESMSYSPKP